MTEDKATDIDDAALAKTKSLVAKAMGVLQEISEDPVQRACYERRLGIAREIIQRDADAKRMAMGGEMAKDSLGGEIEVYQIVLKQPQTPKQDLEKMCVEELRRLADDLRRQIRPEA